MAFRISDVGSAGFEDWVSKCEVETMYTAHIITWGWGEKMNRMRTGEEPDKENRLHKYQVRNLANQIIEMQA